VRTVYGVSEPGIGRGHMRDDWESSQAALLRVEVIHEGAEAIITVEGELAQLTAERFVACVLEALDTKPRSVTVDAQGVTFTDSSGLSAVLRARGLAFVDQVAFRIKDPPPQLRRLVQVSGTEDLLLPDE
jgi:anti-anti-sigma factor